jgi:hypothetical protein
MLVHYHLANKTTSPNGNNALKWFGNFTCAVDCWQIIIQFNGVSDGTG